MFPRGIHPRPLGVPDTPADVRAMQAGLVGAFTPVERARLMRDLTLGTSMLAVAGLRRRYPLDVFVSRDDPFDAERLARRTRVRIGPDEDDVLEVDTAEQESRGP